jgi:hypothetical protein
MDLPAPRTVSSDARICPPAARAAIRGSIDAADDDAVLGAPRRADVPDDDLAGPSWAADR